MWIVARQRADQIFLQPNLALRFRNRLGRLFHQLFRLPDIQQPRRAAVQKGLREIILLTETAPDYFAEKGFQQISRNEIAPEVQQSSEFSHVCPQSAIAMKREIPFNNIKE